MIKIGIFLQNSSVIGNGGRSIKKGSRRSAAALE